MSLLGLVILSPFIVCTLVTVGASVLYVVDPPHTRYPVRTYYVPPADVYDVLDLD